MKQLTLLSLPDYIGYCQQAATRWVQHIKGRYETEICDALLVSVVVELMKPAYTPVRKVYIMADIARSQCATLLHRMHQLLRNTTEPVQCPEVINEFSNFF